MTWMKIKWTGMMGWEVNDDILLEWARNDEIIQEWAKNDGMTSEWCNDVKMRNAGMT